MTDDHPPARAHGLTRRRFGALSAAAIAAAALTMARTGAHGEGSHGDSGGHGADDVTPDDHGGHGADDQNGRPAGAASPSASPGASPTGAAAIAIANFAFTPASITVTAGAVATWTNQDSTPHTVTGDQGEFDSGLLNPGASFSFTLPKAGTVAYHCSFHANMHGTVVVT